MSPRLLTTTIALLLGAAASPLAAQERPDVSLLFGLGGGYGRVSTAAESGSGPLVSARVGVRLSGRLAAVLELGAFGPGNERPSVGDVVVDERGVSTVVVRRPRLLRTSALLAGLQVGSPDGPYLRPAVGLGRHAFAAYGPWPAMDSVWTSSGIGGAVGLSAGYPLRIGTRLRLALEGVAIRSGGGDDGSPRTVLGLQVVPELHR